MPWTTPNLTEQKLLFIEAVRAERSESVAEICARFGISRETGYQALRRFAQRGPAGFEPVSRRPLHSPNAMSPAIEKQIIAARIEHPTWGPRKLRAFLKRRWPRISWPAPSTIGELLRRHGLVHARRHRARHAPFGQPLGHALIPNDVWCTDFKGWFRTLDGARCNPLTIADASTRFLIRCQHLDRPDYAHVKPLFEAAFREYGMPLAIRSDNGPPFASMGVAGLSRLSVWWIRLGIWPERIAPGHPEQNGRQERIHRTMLEVASTPAANSRLQQHAFDRFLCDYNTVRPHEALDNRVPADLYQPSSRRFPAKLPEMVYPRGVPTRSVRPNGEIKHAGRTFFLSESLASERVALWETEHGWDVYFGMIRLGHVDPDTMRLEREPRGPSRKR